MSGENIITGRASCAELDSQLAQIRGNIRAYQKLARQAGAEVRKRSRARIHQQKSLSGGAFAPRRDERNRRKMLLGLAKSLEVISRAKSGGGVVVSWRNALVARVATRHQHGVGEGWNPARAAKVYGTPDYNAPCTVRQARALLREGYRLPVPGKGKARRSKRVPASWLQKNFTLGQAGLILRMMRTGKRRGKQSWRDTPPARAFLGVTPQDVADIRTRMAQACLDKI